MTMQVPHRNHSYSNISFITHDSQNNEVERPGEWITVLGLKYGFGWIYNVYSVISIPWASVFSSAKWGLEAEKSLPALTFHELWFCLSSVIIAFHLLLSPRPISATLHPTLYPRKLTSLDWISWVPLPFKFWLESAKGGTWQEVREWEDREGQEVAPWLCTQSLLADSFHRASFYWDLVA